MNHAMITWIQNPATDLERAVIFYNATFGFEFLLKELNGIEHALIKPDPNGTVFMNGALIKVEKNMGGIGPILFFEATGKFDFMLNAVEENGGQVLIHKTLIKNKTGAGSSFIPKTYIDNEPGYYAHFLDSEGNKMGLYGRN